MLRLLVVLLIRSKKTFTKGFKIRGKIYLLSINEYVPVMEQIKKWECALKVENNQGA